MTAPDHKPKLFKIQLARMGVSIHEPCEPFPEAVSGGGNGVIHMRLLNIIRRMHLRQKLSIREISRLTGGSRIEAIGPRPMAEA